MICKNEMEKSKGESKGKPIEVTFKFPKEPKTVISKVMITVGDKTISAKVMEKEQAARDFPDAEFLDMMMLMEQLAVRSR